MAGIRPVWVGQESPFLGEACALCKQPFALDDQLAICPQDATRHHVHCWQAYGNKCTAYGCTGRGEVTGTARVFVPRTPRAVQPVAARTKVQTLPARSFHCAQSCLVMAIALAIILIAVGCFGLWAIADYLMINVFGLDYRASLAGAIPLFYTLAWSL